MLTAFMKNQVGCGVRVGGRGCPVIPHWCQQPGHTHTHKALRNKKGTSCPCPLSPSLRVLALPGFLVNWHVDAVEGRDPAVVVETHVAARRVLVRAVAAHPVAPGRRAGPGSRACGASGRGTRHLCRSASCTACRGRPGTAGRTPSVSQLASRRSSR